MELIKAIEFALAKHKDQQRKSGVAYYGHLLKVCGEIVNLNQEIPVQMAGVLHDTVEDTDVSLSELENVFGERVASLVSWVTENKELPKIERKRLYVYNLEKAPIEAVYVSFTDKLDNLRDYLEEESSFNEEVREFYKNLLEVYHKRLPREVTKRMTRLLSDNFEEMKRAQNYWDTL